MRYGVVTMFYNEATALKRHIPELQSIGVENILYVDGRFKYFDMKTPVESTDNSREIIESHEGTELITAPLGTILEKMSWTLKEAAKRFDCIIFLDCDEMLYGSWQGFKDGLAQIHPIAKEQSYYIPFFDSDGFYNLRSRAHRCFINFEGLEIKYRHWIYIKDGVRVEPNYTVGGITIIHDTTRRDVPREKQMDNFQDYYNQKIEKAVPLPKMETNKKQMET